jgi:outer membrane autotransporter protein
VPQRTALALAVSALVALPPASQASGFNALPSGDWFDPNNWVNPQQVPTSADNVYINNGGEALIANGGSAVARDLYVGFTASGTSALTITNGSLTAGAGVIIGGYQPAIGRLTVSGPNARLQALSGNSAFYVGPVGTGTLIVENGGQLEVSASAGIIIGHSGGGVGEMIVQGQGSLAALPQQQNAVIIGREGSGTLTVRDGGVVEAGNFRSDPRVQSSRLNVDNGTLRLVRDQSALFSDMPAGSIQVGPGNMTIDTQGFTVQTDPSAPGIEGAGGLTKAGSGTLVLTNANSYSGPTTISAGTLQATGGTAIGDSSAVTVASGATLELVHSGPRVPTVETIGSLAGEGSVRLNDLTALRAGNDNTSTTFAGSIDGPGVLIKLGTGTLRLTGASTGTGLLSVAEGTLDAAGTIPMNVFVNRQQPQYGPAFGTLIGTGTLGSLRNDGLVAPGNSVGTLTVTGDYTQSSTGILEIEIAADGSGADLLAVGGSASLGGTLAARTENQASLVLNPAMDGTYTVLTASGGVTGQFGSAPSGTSGAFRWGTLYNPNDVQIVIDYVGFTAIQTATATVATSALTPAVIPGTGTTNQVSKALALDRVPVVAPARSTATTPGTPTTPSTTTDPGFTSGNPDFDRVLLEIANETPEQLAATYNAIIAEPYAAFMTVLLEQNDFYAETVLERAQLCSARGRGSLAGGYAAPPLAAGERLTDGCPNHERHGVWLDATWLEGNIDGEDGLSGYDYRLSGAVIGADTAVGASATVGAAFGFAQPKLDNYDLADAEIDGDSYFLSAYGTLTQERWEVFGLLGYTFGSYDSERRIRFGSIDRLAKGEFDGDGFIASVKAAYDVPVQGFDLIPEVGLTYSKVWQDGFTETGANSLNLKVDDADAHSLVTSLGVRLGTEVQASATRIRPQLLARYEYDWNAEDDDAHDIISTFADVPVIGPIDVIGQNRGEHGFTLAGSATVQVSERANLFAGAGYRWNSNGAEYNFGVGARMAW